LRGYLTINKPFYGRKCVS